MNGRRTSLVLDDDTRKAALALATHYRCSMSEAIRRAVVRHRDAVEGVPMRRRKERVRALRELAQLFDGHDVEGELQRLKQEDEFA